MKVSWPNKIAIVNLIVEKILFRSMVCIAGLLTVFVDVAMPCYYTGSDYFVTTIGQGIKYQVTDSENFLDCTIWTVSQPQNEGKFSFTLLENGGEGRSFSDGWLGGMYSTTYQSYMFTSKCPVDNQAAYYALFSLLKRFDSGNQWTVVNKKYKVETIGNYTANNFSFCNCIKVTVDNSQDINEYLKGKGYFILAKGT